MQTITCAAAVAIGMRLTLGGQAPLLTVAQRDGWRSCLDVRSAGVSANGRFVAFASYARLVPADTNDRQDIYVLDRAGGRVTLESVTEHGRAANEDSTHPALSGDGRLLVYETHLTSSALAEVRHVMLRDRYAFTTTVVSAGPPGQPLNGSGGSPAISSDGGTVAFTSTAIDLVAGVDANGTAADVYLFDVPTRNIRRVSVDSSGLQRSSGSSFAPSLSSDGRWIAFTSTALLDGAAVANGGHTGRLRPPASHVYVRDSTRGVTRVVSVGPQGRAADGSSWGPAISANGRYVVFVSAATNFAAPDRNRSADVFVADLHTGSTELVSRSVRGGTANGPSGSPAISADGRFIAFQSEASDLVCVRRCTAQTEDINLMWDVFLLDRQNGAIVRMSADAAGGWMEASAGPALDAAGELVVFSSRHPIKASDQRNDFDLFVRAVTPTLSASTRR